MSNNEKEKRAIELVIKYEMKRRNIQSAESITRASKSNGYDLDSGDRKIEIKATGKSNFNTGLRLNSEHEIRNLKNIYIYRVINVMSDRPQLFVVKGSDVDIGKIQLSAAFTVSAAKRGAAIDI